MFANVYLFFIDFDFKKEVVVSIFVAFLLGTVQGLTEFLPVSSSGHLVLLERLFGIKTNLIFLNVILHLGTLCAVIVFYRKRLWGYVKHPFQKDVGLLAIATVPTLIVFLIFRSFIESSFSGEYLVFGFLVTAIILIATNIVVSKQKNPLELNYKTAIVMGVFQGFATLPGISRSGNTIAGGVVMGSDKDKVADFSFLMSIPIITGSLLLEIIKLNSQSLSIGVLPLIVGFIFSFIFGLVSIKFMLMLFKKAKFYWFSIYLVVLSVCILVFNI